MSGLHFRHTAEPRLRPTHPPRRMNRLLRRGAPFGTTARNPFLGGRAAPPADPSPPAHEPPVTAGRPFGNIGWNPFERAPVSDVLPARPVPAAKDQFICIIQ